MLDRRECPQCGTTDTDVVYRDHQPDETIEIRICDDCAIEFTGYFSLSHKEIAGWAIGGGEPDG